jgi:hypothetical protein
MNNDYAKRIADAVIEAAAKLCEETRVVTVGGYYDYDDGQRTLDKAADAIRSLDLDAIIASVPGPKEIPLNVIRNWPDGFQARLEHVWRDLIGFIPNYKLYDLQRMLAEYGFTMNVYEFPPQPKESHEQDRTGSGSQQLDISRQIAKASAYLDRTRSEFAQNARNAKRLLGQAESGALVGPVTNALPQAPQDQGAKEEIEHLDIENHRLRRGMQKLMPRLTDLLDEDQFADCESIVTSAGVSALQERAAVSLSGVTDAEIRELAHRHLLGTGDDCIIGFARALLSLAQSSEGEKP